jgi:hypothetical protein
MAGVFLAWLCFYELRPEVLWLKLGTVFSPGAYTPGALRAAALLLPGGDPFVLGCLLALVACVLGLEWLSVRRHDEPYVLLRRPLVLALLVVLTVLLAPGKANSFIYFAF